VEENVLNQVYIIKKSTMDSISTSYHSKLANYFTSRPLYLDEPTQKKPNTRKLVEQPWQQTNTEMWDDVIGFCKHRRVVKTPTGSTKYQNLALYGVLTGVY
jgi:hypothetical protein